MSETGDETGKVAGVPQSSGIAHGCNCSKTLRPQADFIFNADY
jgi:hypothetical protein